LTLELSPAEGITTEYLSELLASRWLDEELDESGNVPEFRYTPHGVLSDLFNYTGPELVLSGPAGTGKTLAILHKVNLVACMYPGTRALLVRKTQVSLSASALVTWQEKVIHELERAGLVKYFGGSAVKPPAYEYANRSKVLIGGLDNANKVLSTEYDLIAVVQAEELTQHDWETLTTRLRHNIAPFQQIIADCNPDAPNHWLKRRADNGELDMYHSRHQNNPFYWDEEAGDWTEAGRIYIDRLERLTGVRYHRLRHGEWVAAEGMIYEEWNSAENVRDPIPLPGDWPRFWVIDFGYARSPMVVQQWADSGDVQYCYREWIATGTLVEDMARKIMATVAPDGKWAEPRPSAVICDHDAEGRGTFERHTGLYTVAADKKVKEGIEAMATRVRDRRFRVFSTAVVERPHDMVEELRPIGLAEEVGGYVWDANKEQPVKINDHSMDCARYLAAHLERRSRGKASIWKPRLRVPVWSG
jgi:PBSX family phage terminase large subunit